MIPPILDFDKDPVLGFHSKDILRNKYSRCGVTQFDENRNQKNHEINEIEYDGINDDIYEDDDNGYEERMIQNQIDENYHENDNNNDIDDDNDDKNINVNDPTKSKEVATEINSSYNIQEDYLWLGYVSTTGVYGNHNGDWVTEESATLAPTTSKAYHRIIAENDWLALRNQIDTDDDTDSDSYTVSQSDILSPSDSGISNNLNVRVASIYPHVFRLGGIYGPGRSALDTIKKSKLQNKPLLETTEISGVLKQQKSDELVGNEANEGKKTLLTDENGNKINNKKNERSEAETGSRYDIEKKGKDDEIISSTTTEKEKEEKEEEEKDKITRNESENIPNWVSRIHVTDICNAIIASMLSPIKTKSNINAIYNVVDNQPESRETVMKFSNNLLSQNSEKVEEMGIVDLDSQTRNLDIKKLNLEKQTNEFSVILDSVKSENSVKSDITVNLDLSVKTISSERSKRRKTENKRVSNIHLRESLGFELKYPTYKEGIRALFLGSNDPFE